MSDVTDVANKEEAAPAEIAPRKVLNAGSGIRAPHKLHELFRTDGWHEVRLDIDPGVKPDVVASLTDLAGVPDASFDAVWTSHSLEHLYAHEVPAALAAFHRVLKNDGFLLIACPDLEGVAQAVLDKGLEETLYVSPAGPVAALDILFGHGASIAKGNSFMAHRTGFTVDRLGRLLMAGGFAEARVMRQSSLELFAVALMPDTDEAALIAELDSAGLNFGPPSG